MGGAAFVASELWEPSAARAQTPPNCPPAPVNGTPFKPGQDSRSIVQRKSVNSLSAAELAEFKSAFAKLRALPSSDNRRLGDTGRYACALLPVMQSRHSPIRSRVVELFPLASSFFVLL